MPMVHVLIDNAGGEDGEIRKSPDGIVKEWLLTRQVARILHQRLLAAGIPATRIVPENIDVPLSDRARRVNAINDRIMSAGGSCILVSVSCSMSGRGHTWYNASGFSAHVPRNAKASSIELAKCLWTSAIRYELDGTSEIPQNRYLISDTDLCWRCKCTNAEARLIYLDNRDDNMRVRNRTTLDNYSMALCEGIRVFIKKFKL